MNAFSYDVSGDASPTLRRLLGGLRQRRGLHQAMGRRVQNRTRDHLIRLATSRHATAQRLGAQPSGFLGQAAEKTGLPASLTADNSAAVLALNHPGLRRAFGDVEIKPGAGKKSLTIPVIAAAYNQRAYRLWVREGLFVIRTDKGAFAVKRAPDQSLVAYYKLVPSVRQRQDRSLLPSDAEIKQAALQGADDYLALLLQKGGRG